MGTQRLIIALACWWGFTPAALGQQQWDRFRGPNGTGLADEARLPSSWTAADLMWRAKLPGTGHSSPVLRNGRLITTCWDSRTASRYILCVEPASGEVLWQKKYPLEPYRQHADNSYASSTPAVDGDRIYIAWTTPQECLLLALDYAGGEQWKISLGPYVSQHGSGVSPIVFEDMVILVNDHEGPESFVIAVDSRTGRTRWRIPRRSTHMAAATPCLYYSSDGSPQLVLSGRSEGLSALDPRTGRLLWQVADVFQWRVVGSPVVAAGLVIGSCGEGGTGKKLVAVRPGAQGVEPRIVWSLARNVPYVPTPLAKGPWLFALSDGGVISCLEASSGRVVWEQRLGASFYSSPICVGDRLYCVSKKGQVFILRAAQKYELLGTAELGETCYATPAVADGRIFFRTYSHLMCLGAGRADLAADRQ